MAVYDIIPDIWNVILSKVDNMLDIINIYDIFNGSKIILNSSSFWINRFKRDKYYIIQSRNSFYKWITEYNYLAELNHDYLNSLNSNNHFQNAYNKYIKVKTKFDNKNLSGYASPNNKIIFKINLGYIINHNIDVPNFTEEELNKIYNIISLTEKVKIYDIIEDVKLKPLLVIITKITSNKEPISSDILITSHTRKGHPECVFIEPDSHNIYKSFDISFDDIILLLYKLAYYNAVVTDYEYTDILYYSKG